MPTEKSVLFREYKNGYYPIRAFSAAKILNTVLFQCLYSVLFSVPVYFMTGLREEVGSFLCFAGQVALMGNIGAVTGLAIGAAVKDVNFASTIVPAGMTPMIIFSGFLQHVSNIHVWFKWLYWLSFFQWGFRGLTLNEFANTGEASLDYFDTCGNEAYAAGVWITYECPYGTNQAGTKTPYRQSRADP